MSISPIQFGRNLRPSTVDALNKINEIIVAVNAIDPSGEQAEINALKTRMTNAESRITTNTGDIATLQTTTADQQDDIDDIKTTLYTPLASDENN